MLSGTLRPGEGSDGMEPGLEYVEVELGDSALFPACDSRVVLNQIADGSVDMTVTGSADFGQILLPTLGVSLRLEMTSDRLSCARGTSRLPDLCSRIFPLQLAQRIE
jgi:hypothetical protein